MNDSKDIRRERVEAALDRATAPLRRLVYSTPQLVLASPFGIVNKPAEIVRNTTRRLLQTEFGGNQARAIDRSRQRDHQDRAEQRQLDRARAARVAPRNTRLGLSEAPHSTSLTCTPLKEPAPLPPGH